MSSRKLEKKDRLYWEFDEALALKSSDENIKIILSKFKKEDFLSVPVIFDLVAEKRLALLSYLFDSGVSFSYRDNSRATALHVACGASGSLATVKFFFERNIFMDVNAPTDEGETPFLLAVMYEHEDILHYFFEHCEPDFSSKTIYGDTALSLAYKTGNARMLRFLREHVQGYSDLTL